MDRVESLALRRSLRTGTGVGRPRIVSFHKSELNIILSTYGRMVACGEWRDYGISHLEQAAVFSVFRRTAETPLYRIEKRPNPADRQGIYRLIGADGRILRRGHDLRQVMRFFQRKLLRLVD